MNMKQNWKWCIRNKELEVMH